MVLRLDGQGCVRMPMPKMLARGPLAGVAWESPPLLLAQRRAKSYHQPLWVPSRHPRSRRQPGVHYCPPSRSRLFDLRPGRPRSPNCPLPRLRLLNLRPGLPCSPRYLRHHCLPLWLCLSNPRPRRSRSRRCQQLKPRPSTRPCFSYRSIEVLRARHTLTPAPTRCCSSSEAASFRTSATSAPAS
jgi:hypothetical protein